MTAQDVQQDTVAGTDIPAEPETPPTAQDGSSEPTDAELRSREAASYRARLRAAEEQLELRDGVISGLRAEVDRLHRTEVERVAGHEGMAHPPDLWEVGTKLSALRDDDGRLDPGKVTETVRDVLAARPRWRRELPDLGSGPRESAGAREPGLADLLGKRR